MTILYNMVKSQIYPDKINYNESKQVDDEDIGYASTIYDIVEHNIPIEIALGKEKHTYANHNIVYFSVYLILDNILKSRIGIVEIENNRLIDSIDEDGDFIIENGNLLIFVNEDYLHKLINNKVVEGEGEGDIIDEIEKETISIKDDDVVIDNIENVDIDYSKDSVLDIDIPSEKKSYVVEDTDKVLKDGIFELMDPIPSIETLIEENKEMSEQIKKDYNPSSKHIWIEKFMKNTYYDIVDNEGSGDCFFCVIRDAYSQIGKKTTVEKLRAMLSNEVTDDIFQEYRMLYNGFNSQYQELENDMKEMRKVSQSLKSRSKASISREQNTELLDEANRVVDKYKQLSLEKKEVKQLMSEFDYMKDLTTLDSFKDFIKTRFYWADTWAVSTLEKLLNIKIIIMSELAYKSGDLDSVLNCGQLNDNELESKGGYNPENYIITSYDGRHYTLITYKDKKIFKFNEVPYDVKALIINKCMEKNAGPYYLIQDMRTFKTKLGLDIEEGKVTDDDEYMNMDLYDNDIVFMFHSNSNNLPKPGKGSGEKIKDVNILEYHKLSKIQNWRKKLDDSWIAPFELDNHRWNSVEHYVLGSQFKKGFPDFYLKFSLDSDSEISKDLVLARIAGSKTGKIKNNVLRDSKILIDPDFYEIGVNPRHREERFSALKQKFKTNLDLKQVLLETKRAKLNHFIRGREPEIDILLMKLRQDLIN